MKTIIATLLFAGSIAGASEALAESTYAQVVIYDVTPGAGADFEKALASSRQDFQARAGLINERVLASLDADANKYATYAKFSSADAAQAALAARLKVVQRYLRRPAETHVAAVSQTFTASSQTSSPQGTEFGLGQSGQIAHLGLFVPFNGYWSQYQASLTQVKTLTAARKPSGYFGDDIMAETSAPAPAAQTPYSPHPAEAAKMSINYGEYQTLEDAENSYVQRHDSDADSRMASLSRIFFGSLQVPARFYIFKVVDNYNGPVAAQRIRSTKAIALRR
jgi:hypothetical protein